MPTLTATGYSPEPTVVSIKDSNLKVKLKFIAGNRLIVCRDIMEFCFLNNLEFNIFSEPMSIAKSANYTKDLVVELSKYLTADNIRIQPPDGDIWNLTT